MVRFEKVLLTVGLVVTTTGVVRAQHEGHHDAAGIQAALLTNRSVQKELKLNGAQVEIVASLAKDVAAKGRAAALEFKALPDSERREKMQVLMTAVCAEAMSTLRDVITAEQFKRFDQIVLQQRGIMAFADVDIQGKLQLTSEQKDRLHGLAMDLHGQMRSLSQNAGAEKMREVHEQGMVLHRKAFDQAVATLTAEQRTTWTELTGDHFDVKFEGRPATAVAR
jgi:hypothetical protein